jgi:hypothetical protein
LICNLEPVIDNENFFYCRSGAAASKEYRKKEKLKIMELGLSALSIYRPIKKVIKQNQSGN